MPFRPFAGSMVCGALFLGGACQGSSKNDGDSSSDSASTNSCMMLTIDIDYNMDGTALGRYIIHFGADGNLLSY